jgi:HD superfamily phosphohydrolase
MYWQVYLHKTAIAAEKMLANTLQRAKELANNGVELFASPALHYFLYHSVTKQMFEQDENALTHFANLDDNDIWTALKVWTKHPDTILSLLSSALLNRNIFKIEIETKPFPVEYVEEKQRKFADKYAVSLSEALYLIPSDEISTNMYNEADDSIDILFKDGTTKDIAEASDMLNIQLLSKKIRKYYCCFLRD